MPVFRANVALILQNCADQILICERSDWPGCWQFPQGGLKKGESLLEALHREVREELCLEPQDYRVIESRGPYRYLFSEGHRKAHYDGQEQHYFLARTVQPGLQVRFDGESGEFRAARWIAPVEYDLAWIAPMKREVYGRIFQDFFGITPVRAAAE